MAEEAVEHVDVEHEADPVDYATMTQAEWKAFRRGDTVIEHAELESEPPEEDPVESAPTDDEPIMQAEDLGDVDERPSRVQKRINTLTKRTKEAEALAHHEREARLALEARLLALEQGQQQPSNQQEHPEPTGPPDPDDYETQDAYVTAVARHEAQTMLREAREHDAMQQRLNEQQAQITEARQQLQASVAAARDAYDDFDEVMENPEVEPSALLKKAVAYNDQAGHLGYYLVKNPDEMDRLNTITSPATMLRELARFEARVLPPEPPETPAPKARRTPSAPPPGTPPRGDRGGGGTRKRPEDMTYREYREHQLGKQR